MANRKHKPYPPQVDELFAKKSAVLSQAHALTEMGMTETATPLWASAAGYEEQLAPLLEVLGRDREAAIHRISAGTCFMKAGDRTRAANHFRAALAGPILKATRREVEGLLDECLRQLATGRGRIGKRERRGAAVG